MIRIDQKRRILVFITTLSDLNVFLTFYRRSHSLFWNEPSGFDKDHQTKLPFFKQHSFRADQWKADEFLMQLKNITQILNECALDNANFFPIPKRFQSTNWWRRLRTREIRFMVQKTNFMRQLIIYLFTKLYHDRGLFKCLQEINFISEVSPTER